MSLPYHAHFLPCPCGAGAPDYGWYGAHKVAPVHYAQCPCGAGAEAASEDACAAQWNAFVRRKGALAA